MGISASETMAGNIILSGATNGKELKACQENSIRKTPTEFYSPVHDKAWLFSFQKVIAMTQQETLHITIQLSTI